MLRALIEAGMDVARLNFSHGTPEEHIQHIRNLRACSEALGRPVAILQDLAGPKIRVGPIAGDGVNLRAGSAFTLTARPVLGNEQEASVTYPHLRQEVQVGDTILLADGAIELKVTDLRGEDILCRVLVGGALSSHKGINLPQGTLKVPALTEKDERDLALGLEHGVDYVALSFVRRAEDIQQVRRLMAEYNRRAPIIAKIEKHEALENIDEIVAEADGVMVARGDLAVETALERVPVVQKQLIRQCNVIGKPVITATQMLKSMVDSPRPTRAEATDVANAVLDGTDAVMLSEETAIGKYAVEAVEVMARIAERTEQEMLELRREVPFERRGQKSIAEAVSHASYGMAFDLRAAAIITPTHSGSTARLVARYRPQQPIIAFSPIPETVRRLALIWGVYPHCLLQAPTSDEMIERVKQEAQRLGYVKPGDTVVITAGVPVGRPGTTNLIKAEVIE